VKGTSVSGSANTYSEELPDGQHRQGRRRSRSGVPTTITWSAALTKLVSILPTICNAQIQHPIPISCVEVAPVRRGERGAEAGLTSRST
jgi:hypothetical protein